MRQAARRMVGIGGATAVAIGAALVLALPASAHTSSLVAGCNDGHQATASLSLTNYSDDNGKKPNANWVTLTETTNGQTTNLLATQQNPSGKVFFSTQFSFHTTDVGTVDHAFHMQVFAWDDPTGAQGFSRTRDASSGLCVTTTTTTAPPTTTTTAPPTTTTTAPPTTTTKPPTVPPTTTTAPPTTTTTPAVAAATTTPSGGGTLPFTGVNAALPLGIAGVLVLAGGAILAWLRFGPRRRKA